MKCSGCNSNPALKDLIIKMGGLICPSCSRILIFPYEELFNEERKRRNKEYEDKEKINEPT